MKNLLRVLFCAALTVPAHAQLTVDNVTLPAVMKAGDSSIRLNGGGIRKKLFFKLYVGGLYLTRSQSDAEAIINADEAMAVKLQITSDMINSDNMSQAINEGFDKSTGGNSAALKDRITRFVDTFRKSPITEGDVFDIVYVPGTGVNSYKNGKLQSTVKGLDFKRALFGIWLSKKPADVNLKKAMLGK